MKQENTLNEVDNIANGLKETIVVEQLEWLLQYELNTTAESRDRELINALIRVLEELKVTK